MHPATAALLRFFEFSHLPPQLQPVSAGFHTLAHRLVSYPALGGPELTMALRKLLEAKDCAVRAALPSAHNQDALNPPPAPGQDITNAEWSQTHTGGGAGGGGMHPALDDPQDLAALPPQDAP